MPRGKNYFNQNRGMTLQASSNDAVREACFFGRQCTRPDCIYRHPEGKEKGSLKQKARTDAARAPCKAFLAGHCPYDESVCHKRHPPAHEIPGWLQKYSKIPCRNGTQKACPVKGCLYYHPPERSSISSATNQGGELSESVLSGAAFPPLEASFPPLPTSAEKPSEKSTKIADTATKTITTDANPLLTSQSDEQIEDVPSRQNTSHLGILPATSAWQQAPVGNISSSTSRYTAPWLPLGDSTFSQDQSTDASRGTDLNVTAKEFVPSFLK